MIEYSCSIEWFNETIFDPSIPGDRKLKVMLLGANHTF